MSKSSSRRNDADKVVTATTTTDSMVVAAAPDMRRWLACAVYVVLVAMTLFMGRQFVTGVAIDWRHMGMPFLIGTISLALASFLLAAINFSLRNAVVHALLTIGISWLAEAAGVLWGIPFGHLYYYHGELQPRLPGGVPLLIPLAWYALACAPLMLMRKFPVTDRHGKASAARVLAKAILSAFFLMACDLVLDPLAVLLNAWTWMGTGGYFGIPYTNFIGWFVVGLVIYAVYYGLESRWGRPRTNPWHGFDKLWILIQTICFMAAAAAAWNHLESALPAILALLCMFPYWLFWRIQEYRHLAARSVATNPHRRRPARPDIRE